MAVLNAGLGGATATAGLADSFKTYYNRTLLENARNVLVHQKFGDPQDLPKNSGKTMEMRRAGVMAIPSGALQEGVTPTENTFSYSAITVTIAQYGDYVIGSDVVKTVIFDKLMDDLSEEMGDQAGRKIEDLTVTGLNAGTNVIYPGTVVARAGLANTDKLNSATLVRARKVMRTNNARPADGRWYPLIIHPNTEADLLLDTSIVAVLNAGNNGGQALRDGELGRYLGISFWYSNLARVLAAGTNGAPVGVNVYSSLCFGRKAFGMVELDGMGMETFYEGPGSAGTADPLHQRWTYGWKATYAVKILNESFMLRIEHAAQANG